MTASATVARGLQPHAGVSPDIIGSFLVSPEVDALLRRLYAARTTQRGSAHIEDARQAFVTSLSLRLGLPEHELGELATSLFNALKMGCERAIQLAIDQGLLSAHEAKSADRQRQLLDELAAIREELALLRSPEQLRIPDILEFEAKYRELVGQRHAFITPPHFDAARRLPINDLFVSSDIVRLPRRKAGEATPENLQQFLSTLYRAVLLGNPGAGKSTLASKLCHDLSTRYSDRLVAGRQVTPILVVLRDFGAEKRSHRCSIIQHIESTANAKYQLAPPPQAFQYLLLSGRAMVIFDGLDELLDTHYREEIVGDVESFCTLYPSVPVLVTTREVGYDKAPLDERRFEAFRLADFDDSQVQDYVEKWFAADIELPAAQRASRAAAFLEESAIVPDLRANPLMLALMCNIYRGESYIPRNRPDVYEKCAVMLFERWDKGRGILVPLPFEAHISPTMKYLAHWIYSSPGLEGGVTERRLVDKATEYLCSWRFENREDAVGAARQFIEFCQGRAWVFTDTGVEKHGERLYQFTHRTFLEYFTAAHLVRTHPTPDTLATILLPRIIQGEWDVVGQLAFQLQHKNVEGAADQLLSTLLTTARDSVKAEEAWSLESFAARSLEFLVPRPRMAREVAIACFRRCLAWGEARRGDRTRPYRPGADRGDPRALLGALVLAADENRPAIADGLRRGIGECVAGRDDLRALLALEVGLHFTLVAHRAEARGHPRSDTLEFWSNQSNEVFQDSRDRILILARTNRRICTDALWRGAVTIGEYVEWFGLERAFVGCGYMLFPGTMTWSPAEAFLADLLRGQPLPPGREAGLGHLGKLIAANLPIRLQTDRRSWRFRHAWFTAAEKSDDDVVRDLNHLSSDALFGGLLILAILSELEQGRPLEDWERHREISGRPTNWLVRIVFSRFKRDGAAQGLNDLGRLHLTRDQGELMRKWIHNEVNFVTSTDTRPKDEPTAEEDT
jgi:hypothetical protein